jgi:hypothetical protein
MFAGRSPRRSLDLPHEQERLRNRGNVAHEQHAQAPRQQRRQRDQLELGRRPGSPPDREFSGQVKCLHSWPIVPPSSRWDAREGRGDLPRDASEIACGRLARWAIGMRRKRNFRCSPPPRRPCKSLQQPTGADDPAQIIIGRREFAFGRDCLGQRLGQRRRVSIDPGSAKFRTNHALQRDWPG